eukprot:CAMPEP_0170526974 /NCGR_PEP_ID=MMETSP0209-20121228/12374_1 /TAXON_ID=665100 ORGANISM="Litonotus pictus, Strain P1" /NCGR_SAMPLE_ID=MMETSP0209 /ASSEMBLY_ACC=CAM_ASM_000301 /LENGTH=502 /DNA_ID=CAMNT_0010817129 /DNA_START=25 /DNA_END=1529 /DNA_ORIENTATION=+
MSSANKLQTLKLKERGTKKFTQAKQVKGNSNIRQSKEKMSKKYLIGNKRGSSKTKVQEEESEQEDQSEGNNEAAYDEDDSLDMDDFQDFNDKMFKKDLKAAQQTGKSLQYSDNEASNEEFNEDEEYEDEDEEEEYGDNEEDSVANKQAHELMYSDMYEPIKKKSKVKEIDDHEIEDEIFAREHEYSTSNNKDKANSKYSNSEIISQIENMEENMVGKKQWHLKGEVSAKERPLGSLLEHNTDFKVSARPKPLPSAEINSAIEKMIRLRISNDLFDDPKRTVIKDGKKEDGTNEIQYSKSKKGLAELYEEDFGKTQSSSEPLSYDKIIVEEMMDDLFTMFNGLTNSAFVGERVKSEMNVVKNVKAIKLEDVSKFVPSSKVNTKDEKSGKLLSEYNPNKSEVVTNEELDSQELRKKHRQMKRKVHKKIYERNIKKKMNNLANDYGSKYEVRLAMKQSKDKLEKIDVKSKELKSGKFFEGLTNSVKVDKEMKQIKSDYQKSKSSG